MPWDDQVPALADAGLRCVLYDRRGHGRSGRPATGYDFDTVADDLAAIIEQFDLHHVTLVGHSSEPGNSSATSRVTAMPRVDRMALVGLAMPMLRQT
jgi:non-heme chloroperoxidase